MVYSFDCFDTHHFSAVIFHFSIIDFCKVIQECVHHQDVALLGNRIPQIKHPLLFPWAAIGIVNMNELLIPCPISQLSRYKYVSDWLNIWLPALQPKAHANISSNVHTVSSPSKEYLTSSSSSGGRLNTKSSSACLLSSTSDRTSSGAWTATEDVWGLKRGSQSGSVRWTGKQDLGWWKSVKLSSNSSAFLGRWV